MSDEDKVLILMWDDSISEFPTEPEIVKVVTILSIFCRFETAEAREKAVTKLIQRGMNLHKAEVMA